MKVTAALLGKTRANRTREGVEIRETWQVSGLSGSRQARVAQAMNAPGLPRLGAGYAGQPGAELESIDLMTLAGTNDTAELELTWRTPNADSAQRTVGGVKVLDVEFFATTITERRNTDAAGAPMINRFRGPIWLADESFWGVTNLAESVEADILAPQFGVRIRHERAELPKRLATELIGSVNADRWSGYAPATWLCTGLATDNRGGGPWVSVFEALYRPQGWRYVHAVRFDNQVPENAVPGNGIATFDVYPRRNWLSSGLGVAF